ncbi:hypothetical protein BpHYR1_029071 [Brachionus plicatilis]|uniref:Uncharacterized protein n=1 Tax=Brachionus plicatilis TaxID=10195 RepID=A0A3M7PLP9_BRAPC|nr:hypothetical protein BpHYR1_029071 [Brachionus plicatilis]
MKIYVQMFFSAFFLLLSYVELHIVVKFNFFIKFLKIKIFMMKNVAACRIRTTRQYIYCFTSLQYFDRDLKGSLIQFINKSIYQAIIASTGS